MTDDETMNGDDGSPLERVLEKPVLRSPHAICRWELGTTVPARQLRAVAVGFCGALLRKLGPAVDEIVVQERLAVFAMPRIPASVDGGDAVAVGISVPRKPSDEAGQALKQAIGSISDGGFDAGGRIVRLRPPRAPGLDAHRWVGPSRVWTTVTPVVLGTKLAAKRAASRTRAVLDSLGLALLGSDSDSTHRSAAMDDLVTEVQLHEEAWITGLPPARSLVDGRPTDASAHVRVAFREPVEGPIVIGRDRLLGMGLLAPL